MPMPKRFQPVMSKANSKSPERSKSRDTPPPDSPKFSDVIKKKKVGYQANHGIVEKMQRSEELKNQEYKPMHIQ
jgi:hypothetical protein